MATQSSVFLLQFKHPKFKPCKGIDQPFRKPKKVCQKATTCLNRSELVNYYNELVIHLGIAENLLVSESISREIQESVRTIVAKRLRKVIELLRENILPLMDAVVSIKLYYNYSYV